MAAPRKHFGIAKALLAEHGEMQAKDLAAAMGVNCGTMLAALACPIRDGEVIKRTEGRAVFYSLGEERIERVPVRQAAREEAAAPKFNASLWADGELILWNVKINEDGRSLTLDADQAGMLRRLLQGGVA